MIDLDGLFWVWVGFVFGAGFTLWLDVRASVDRARIADKWLYEIKHWQGECRRLEHQLKVLRGKVGAARRHRNWQTGRFVKEKGRLDR